MCVHVLRIYILRYHTSSGRLESLKPLNSYYDDGDHNPIPYHDDTKPS